MAFKKTASKKGGSTKTTKKNSGSGISKSALDVSKNKSVNIREIENGFIVSESGYIGTGRSQKYFSREYFSPTEPQINVPKKSSFTLKKN